MWPSGCAMSFDGSPVTVTTAFRVRRMISAPYQLFAPNQTRMPSYSHIHPTYQSLYGFDYRNSTWSPTKHSPAAPILQDATFAVLTWNIDFSAPLPILRFQTVLSHLEQLLSPLLNSDTRPPTIILLQEVHKSCFPTLLSNIFIRAMYDITDVSPASWDNNSSYGSLTLVPKLLSAHVTSVFRTPFPTSKMGRDALYIDFGLPQSSSERPTTKIRVANTHLESLPGSGDSARAEQLASISQFLSCRGISGGLVGGDMNAISPSDTKLSGEVGLLDAWLDKTDDTGEGIISPRDEDSGHTWGYQPPTVFPPGRLDKVLFTGDLKVEDVERVGVNLKFTAQEGAEGDDSWVSDHYGLLARVIVVLY